MGKPWVRAIVSGILAMVVGGLHSHMTIVGISDLWAFVFAYMGGLSVGWFIWS